MKRISGLAMASAALFSLPAHARFPLPGHVRSPDPTPAFVTDAQGATFTGPLHLDGAAFSLVVSDWWLAGAIPPGPAQDVRLIVEVHLPRYPLIDRATDASGRKLDVVVLHRGPSARWPKKASERVAVVLPRDLAARATATGLDITVAGQERSFAVSVPAAELAGFLDAYARATAATGASTASLVPNPVSAPPAASPPPDEDSPAIAPVQDRRVRLPDGRVAPTPAPTPAPPPAPAIPPAPRPPLVSLPGSATFQPQPADAEGDSAADAGGHGIWIDSLGLEFVPTSSGAMVLMTRRGSIAAAKGIQGGDFIEAVDGVPITALDGPHRRAKIGAPGAKVLHMIAAGNVKIR